MGCTVGRTKEEKFAEESSVVATPTFKIQTVFKLDPVNSNHKTKSSKRTRTDYNYRKSRDWPELQGDIKRKGKTKRNLLDPRITTKYNVKGVIGKGTFSHVLRVEQKATRQPYALKVMESAEEQCRFEAELSVLRRLNHPNVIKLVQAFQSNNIIYMVMELATGGNLLDRLELCGPFSEDKARSILQMVLNGVKYLHSVGITHRDLKPDNLLYYHPGNDSRIIIADFSLASTRQTLQGGQFMHTICGTPQYVAPEIVAQRPYTCAVDMWAVGVITYIILSNTFPFDADLDAQIFKLILKGHVRMTDPVWRTFSDEAKVFVLQLLQHDPATRLTSSEAVHHQWLIASRLTYSSSSLSGNSSKSSSPDHHCSQRSAKSQSSSKSAKSVNSLRSDHHKLNIQQLAALSKDPEIANLL